MVSLESFTITGTNEVVKAGDSVLMRCSENENATYMACVSRFEADDVNGDVKAEVKMYYRPEDTIGGRSEFYGIKELFLTNHFTTVDTSAILHRINVHSFVNYTKLKTVDPHDYVYRFEYEIGTGCLSALYCKCRLPFNPDVFMLECEACKELYHPACINMTTDEAKKLYSFTCDKCPTPSMLEKLEEQLEKQARAAQEREQAAKERQQAADELREAEEQARAAKERQQAAEERERAAEERERVAVELVKDITNMMKTLKPPRSAPPT